MNNEKAKISAVLEGSLAKEANIEEGDLLLSVNGKAIYDIFDYKYEIANEKLVLKIEKSSGEIWEIEIEKDEYEDIGIEFCDYLINKEISCSNNCIFCFIDQLPKEMRKTLYYKDDDSRLSFLTGNYVTLTNMSTKDIKRIIKYKMSPINISVHTTNSKLRIEMMKNKFAGDIVKKIKMLAKGGISINCQIVLCRDINDGEEMNKTIMQLSKFYPKLQSISVVPVGLTKYRDDLYPLKFFDKESSKTTLDAIRKLQKHFKQKYNSNLVYAADELYLKAKQQIPQYEEYEDFHQIENGVGMVAMFEREVDESLKKTSKTSHVINSRRNVSIATGKSIFERMKNISERIMKEFNIKISVYSINNDFFGEGVTVTGLITGKDLQQQLSKKELGQELLISKTMLKAEENLFLDDITIEEIESSLNTKIKIVENNGKDFIEKVLGIVV